MMEPLRRLLLNCEYGVMNIGAMAEQKRFMGGEGEQGAKRKLYDLMVVYVWDGMGLGRRSRLFFFESSFVW